MRFAIGVPNVGEYGDPRVAVDLAVGAERAGWDGVFLWDHILYRNGWDVADPWVVLSAIAAKTSRVRIALLVAALPRQHPGEVAKRAVTLDHLSLGRFTLGAGIGSMHEEYAAFAQDPDPRARGKRLDETLSVVGALWRGRALRFSGEYLQVDVSEMRPPPLQQPRIPVWIGDKP